MGQFLMASSTNPTARMVHQGQSGGRVDLVLKKRVAGSIPVSRSIKSLNQKALGNIRGLFDVGNSDILSNAIAIEC